MKIRRKIKRTLFVAYPWNVYVQNMYEDIFSKLFKKWDIRHGSNVTLRDPGESEVEKFVNRNKHLYDVFVSAIEKSDFFIADVTGVNPNVMLELGIAIQLNKNVLIVTNDKLEKLPFDIRGFRVSRYENKNNLMEIIQNELKVFMEIKAQNFSNYFKEFYFNFPSEGELRHGQMLSLPIPKNIKNLRLQIEYKFLGVSNSHDWLGIHLRTKTPDRIESELIYVRKNKQLESVSFPGRRVPSVGKKIVKNNLTKKDDFKLLDLRIDEDLLKAVTPDSSLKDDKIHNENLGGIILHAHAHDLPTRDKLAIRYKNIKIISLDTISSI